ncbi:MAG: NAD-dependent epimerase/dehydratase family protein [Bdellovibrionales bacterium]|nr:NAD-dependent epimerase/dehydratase family protein [Bdellovibrionales bacterium]
MRILITGGAGFVGSNLALRYRRKYPDSQIIAFDNLKRRGSEINLGAFKQNNIQFEHGDIRQPQDLAELGGSFDLMIEASAEPSVLAGLKGSPNYLLQTNLTGTLNCLEFARAHVGTTVFLSTSRVYSIAPLREIKLRETDSRFEIDAHQTQPGVSPRGVTENFSTLQARSLYGASKLASELVIQEYVDTYGLKAVTNRCGVIAGPGQFGKVDQGVFTLWVANHYFKKSLKYTGFGGQGKQVRDLLHPQDLFELIEKQLENPAKSLGQTFNIGGGRDISTSLRELTAICQRATGNEINIASDLTTTPVDIPLYLSDCSKAESAFGWKPTQSVQMIVEDIAAWIKKNESTLQPIFC